METAPDQEVKKGQTYEIEMNEASEATGGQDDFQVLSAGIARFIAADSTKARFQIRDLLDDVEIPVAFTFWPFAVCGRQEKR